MPDFGEIGEVTAMVIPFEIGFGSKHIDPSDLIGYDNLIRYPILEPANAARPMSVAGIEETTSALITFLVCFLVVPNS